MRDLSEQPVLGHITTFGGHPVSCAAGLATLQTLVKEKDLLEQVPAKSQQFRQRLQPHSRILELRSFGLWMALELQNFNEVQAVINFALAQGVITDWFLFNDRALRIAPPLTISPAEIDFACDVLLAALDQLP